MISCLEAGSSSEGYASFKALVLARRGISGVDVVGLVTNEELCQAVWRIIIKNFMHKYTFIVSKLLR